MNSLIGLLEESADLYRSFLELEYIKYDSVIKNDIETLDEVVAKEQAFHLKMRGLEQNREKLLKSMGYDDKTLKEIIELSDKNDKIILNEKYDELSLLISEVKKISELCKTVIEVRMHKINKELEQLGEKDNTYSKAESIKNKSKSFIISKKI